MFKKEGILLLLSFSFGCSAALADEPFRLGASHTDNIAPNPEASYAAYPVYGQMYGNAAKQAPAPPVKKINAGIQQAVQRPAPPPVQRPVQAPVQRPVQPMQGAVQGVLPPQFLGVWQVLGSRSGVEAQPQYQQGIDNIFSSTTANMWKIQGNPQQGYMLSTDTGVSTALMVETQGNTAILRYQHPIKNTMAQEALVMQLLPGGAQFDGLERISIVKQGEPAPRAKVTYKLIGRRQN